MDFTTKPFAAALKELNTALSLHGSLKPDADPDIKRLYTSGLIKNFEFTYELAIKTMRRWLGASGARHIPIDELTFPELLRELQDRGLIETPATWFAFRKDRNVTSHTYDAALALEVCARLPAFARESARVLTRMEDFAHAH